MHSWDIVIKCKGGCNQAIYAGRQFGYTVKAWETIIIHKHLSKLSKLVMNQETVHDEAD